MVSWTGPIACRVGSLRPVRSVARHLLAVCLVLAGCGHSGGADAGPDASADGNVLADGGVDAGCSYLLPTREAFWCGDATCSATETCCLVEAECPVVECRASGSSTESCDRTWECWGVAEGCGEGEYCCNTGSGTVCRNTSEACEGGIPCERDEDCRADRPCCRARLEGDSFCSTCS